MTGQLPTEFFTRFFNILDFKPQQAEEFQHTINKLCQRAYVHQQLQALPDLERQTYTQLLEQDNISAATISEFISMQINPDLQQGLWQQALIHVWQEVLDAVGKSATKKQKDQIRALLREYSEGLPSPSSDS